MTAIVACKWKDGTTAFRAQIRIKENGKVIYTEVETFRSRKNAKLWGVVSLLF